MYDKTTGNLVDRREMLKVKIVSLMLEARIIREVEQANGGVLREELHNHRVNEVRKAARNAQLAYAFTRGVPLAKVEPFHRVHNPRNTKEVERLCRKYGPRLFKAEDLQAWFKGETVNKPEAIPA